MRSLRSLVFLLAVAALAVACNNPEVRDGGEVDSGTTGDVSDGITDSDAFSDSDGGTGDTDADRRPPQSRQPDLDGDGDGDDISIPTPTQEVFEDPPVIHSVSPSSGPAEGGTLVVVRGDNFTSDVDIYLGGTLQPAVDVIDALELWFMTEPGDPGPASLRIENDAGVDTLPGAFSFEAALRLTDLHPREGASAGGTPVRIEGTGFSQETRILFGDREALDVTVRSSTEIDAVAPGGPANRAVAVRAFDDRIAELAAAFTWRRAPTVASVVPAHGSPTGGDAHLVFGDGLGEDCDILVRNRRAALEADGEGGYFFISPGGSPGNATVAWDCGVRGAGVLDEPMTIGEPRLPGIARVSPPTGLSTGGDLVAIEGAGFEGPGNFRVLFGSAEATVVERTDQWVVVLSPRHASGVVSVRVDVGAERYRLDNSFRYVRAPEFNGLAPRLVPLEGGVVTVQGEALDGVDALLLDDRELEMLSRSGSSIEIVVPPGPAGRAPLKSRVGRLEVPTGLEVSWLDETRYTTFQPVSGPAGGNTRLSVIGDGFAASCTVRLGGQDLLTTRVGTSILQAVTPPSAPGAAAVSVENCGEGTFTFEEPFRYLDPTIFPGGAAGGVIDGELTVTVREFGSFRPVPNATVQVGVRSSTPWVATTTETGEVTFRDPALVGPQTVTAFAPDRGVESIVDVNARRVTLMLAQLPPEPCDPDDPDCNGTPPPRPPEPPPGAVRGYLTGLEKIDVFPDGTVPRAELETTRAFLGLPNIDPGQQRVLYENGPFRITTRLGDFALIARCGYYSSQEGRFTALRIGVVRGLSQRPGDPIAEADIDCNIPLDRGFDVQLDNVPREFAEADGFPAEFRTSVTFDFGTEGMLEGFDRFRATGNPHAVGGLPPLAGPLAGVRYSVTSGVYPVNGTLPSSTTWARNMRSYPSLLRMFPLLPIPQFLIPSASNAYSDGYIEWRYDDHLDPPDFWYLTITAQNYRFDRWTVFVPGDYRSFHVNDFPTWAGYAGPEVPVGTLQVLIRAIRTTDDFDFGNFTRDVLGQGRWQATSVQYQNLILTDGESVGR